MSTSFVHFPLDFHRFARPAARAAECAAAQDRFDEFADALFEKQDSLGLKPWGAYANAARVPDVLAFDRCVADTVTVARIENGRALGKQLDVQGTPTVLVNGWRLPMPPDSAELSSIISEVLAGKRPVQGANGSS